MNRLLFPLAAIIGIGLAYIDSRPAWDDTGLEAFAILLLAAAFGALAPRRPWLWAVLIGGWIPLLALFTSHNSGTMMAFAIAVAGAYLGAGLRRLLAPPNARSSHPVNKN